MNERILQGSLTFLGFSISVIAVIYFAGAYIPDVNEWTQLVALILLGVFFASLGVYIRDTDIGQPFFGDHLRWLRPTYVLYLLDIASGITAEIRFLSIDDVARPVKILVSLLIGVGLILWVARGMAKEKAAEADGGEEE